MIKNAYSFYFSNICFLSPIVMYLSKIILSPTGLYDLWGQEISYLAMVGTQISYIENYEKLQKEKLLRRVGHCK